MQKSSDLAKAVYQLGMQQTSTKPQEAIIYFEEALKLYRPLAEEDPFTYLRDLGTTLNNLGGLYVELNRWKEAEDALREALVVREKLVRHHPGHLPDVAMTWHNLGLLYCETGETQKAEHALEQAARIYRSFKDPGFDTRLYRLASTLGSLANLYFETGKAQLGEKILEEALPISRQLAAGHSEDGLAKLALTL